MENYFKPAGELPNNNDSPNKQEQKKNGRLKFSKDLENKYKTNNKINNIKKQNIDNYLKQIISKPSYDEEIQEAGSIITTLEKLCQMVEDGYNITEAEYLAGNLVSITFQKIRKKGRRF